MVEALALFAGVASTAASYSSALHGPFVLDDVAFILRNTHRHLEEISLEGLIRAAFHGPSPTRALANLSFALNFYLHRFDSFGYHLVNLNLHLLTGIALYYLVLKTLVIHRGPYDRVRPEWMALFAALIWMLHPLHTGTVSYIFQRANGLVSMFFVASLLFYVQGRLAGDRKKAICYWTACGLAAVFAAFSKENWVLLPIFIILYEWYFFQDLSRVWLRRGLFAMVGATLVVVVVLLLLGPELVSYGFRVYQERDFTMGQRLLTESRVVMRYLSLLLFPHPSRLTLLYDFPISYGLFRPATTLLSILGIGALLGAALAIRRREKLLSFAILWWLGNLVLESSFLGLEIIFEHRTYLPSMFPVAVFVAMFFRLDARVVWSSGLCFALAATGAVWTYERNRDWGDDVRLYRDNLRKAPGFERIRRGLAWSLVERGRVLTALGRPEEALPYLEEALEVADEYYQAHHHMGWTQAALGNDERAIAEYRIALAKAPDDPMVHFRLGQSLERRGKLLAAFESYSRAGRLQPRWVDPLLATGSVLRKLGRREDAIALYRKGIGIFSGTPAAKRRLQEALDRLRAPGD